MANNFGKVLNIKLGPESIFKSNTKKQGTRNRLTNKEDPRSPRLVNKAIFGMLSSFFINPLYTITKVPPKPREKNDWPSAAKSSEEPINSQLGCINSMSFTETPGNEIE